MVRPFLAAAAAAVLAATAFAGGTAAGLGVADPTASDAYRDLQADYAAAVDARDGFQAKYDAVVADHHAVVTALEEREAAVADREAALGTRAP